MKKFIALLVVVFAVLVVWRFWPSADVTPQEEELVTPQMSETDNAIYVRDQALTRDLLVAVMQNNENGFAVILQANESGAIGEPIGASALMTPGKTTNVPVTISIDPVNAQKLYAMLYVDTDGNGTFDADTDQPMRDDADNRVYGIFFTSENR